MSTPGRPLVVIGHKNPDTDSICAALAYAALKNHQGERAIAYRAGNLNAQTAWVLEHFGLEAPRLLTDVYPKVADIMVQGDHLIVLRESDTLVTAHAILLKHRFSFLPVADAEGRCAGRITALRIAEVLDDLMRLGEGRAVTVDPDVLASSLPAQVLTASCASGAIRGLLCPAGTLEPASRGVAVIGGGPGALGTALRHEPALVVLCAGRLPASSELDAAEKAGVVVIRTAQDVPGTVVRILLEQPLAEFLDRKLQLLGELDMVRSAARVMAGSNEGGFIVTDPDRRIRGVITRINLLDRGRLRLVLVDHNELGQAVDGAEDADIVEIIDHHRLGSVATDGPITFINRVVGSTSTIVADLYRTHGHTPEPKVAGILLAALLSDTLILRSPTTTSTDRSTAEWLAGVAGEDVERLGERMFEAGSALEGMEPDAILGQDRKLYEESGLRFAVSQIEMVGFGRFDAIRAEVAQELERYRKEAGLGFACLMVTDLTGETSLLLASGDRRVLDAITYPRLGEGLYEMKGVLSRKKQVLPYLLDVIRGAV